MQKIQKMISNKNSKGFTLIEILVVIGIIAILAAIVLIALNPARQFALARDSQRTSNVNAILNAVGQYIAENQGTAPTQITTTLQYVASGQANLCANLIPNYMPALPADPKSTDDEFTDCAASYDTLYTIIEDGDGRIRVCAPNTEENDPNKDGTVDEICVTR